MPTIRKTVTVAVPVREAYDQWNRFEEFPHFMDGLESVERLDDRRLHWRAHLGGKSVEWTAEIVERVPDRRISWCSTSGATNYGDVCFEETGPASCRVDLSLTYEPSSAVEKAGAALGLVEWRVERDLERFRDHVEHHGQPTDETPAPFPLGTPEPIHPLPPI